MESDANREGQEGGHLHSGSSPAPEGAVPGRDDSETEGSGGGERSGNDPGGEEPGHAESNLDRPSPEEPRLDEPSPEDSGKDDWRSPVEGGLIPVDNALKRDRHYLLHVALFVLTLMTTTLAGIDFLTTPEDVGLTSSGYLSLLVRGLTFSIPLLVFLSAHEFGHYFTAKRYGADVTLPYYIPMPFFLFGTMGAVIRIRSQVPSRKAIFDIGVAGPLAGFVVALVFLVVGFLTLPGVDYLYAIHPEYRLLEAPPDYGMTFGSFLLLDLLRATLVPDGAYVPGMNEIYHYPLLAVGWFGMFVTALNMIPVGQLDGGHVIYGMFGRRQSTISRWVVRLLLVAGVGGVLGMLLDAFRGGWRGPIVDVLGAILRDPLEWIDGVAPFLLQGWPGWLFWFAIVRFFVKVDHPPVPNEAPLNRGRMIVGWISLAILILTFSWSGIYERPVDRPSSEQEESSDEEIWIENGAASPRFPNHPG